MIISYQMRILIGDTRTAFTQSEDTNPIPTDKTKRAVPGNRCRTILEILGPLTKDIFVSLAMLDTKVLFLL